MRRRAGVLAALLDLLVGAEAMLADFDVLRELAAGPTHRHITHATD